MAERGGRCRPTSSSRAPRDTEPFDVKRDGESMLILRGGRMVRRLSGVAAEEVRRAIDAGDEATVQRLVARAVGVARRSEHDR